MSVAGDIDGGFKGLLTEAGVTNRAIFLPPLVPVVIGIFGAFVFPRLFELLREFSTLSVAMDSVPDTFVENAFLWFIFGAIIPASYVGGLLAIVVLGVPAHLTLVWLKLDKRIVYVLIGALSGPTAGYLAAGLILSLTSGSVEEPAVPPIWSPNLVLMLYGSATAWLFWLFTSKTRAVYAG